MKKMLTVCSMLVAAMFAFTANASDPVPITVVNTTTEQGFKTSVDLSFPALTEDAILFRFDGATDGAGERDDWDNAVAIMGLKAGATTATAPLPKDFASGYVRFAIVEGVYPDEFLEYVYANGAWLDTGVFAEMNRTCTVIDMTHSTVANQERMISSAYDIWHDSTTRFQYEVYINGSGNAAFCCRKSSASGGNSCGKVAANVRQTMVLDARNKYFSWFGVSTAGFNATDGMVSEETIGILGRDTFTHCKGYIYGCSITNDNDCVRDFIPAKYNGNVGLYDRINAKFYTSASATPFEKKPYTEVERDVTPVLPGVAVTALSPTIEPGSTPSVRVNRVAAENGTTAAFTAAVLSATDVYADVMIAYGTSPDALSTTNMLANNVAKGASFTNSIHDLEPDTLYYYSVFARCGDIDLTPSPVATFFTPVAGYEHRSVKILTLNKNANDEIESVTLGFTYSTETNTLYRLSGKRDAGSNVASWEKSEYIDVIQPGEMTRTIPVPAGWGGAIFALRFALTDGTEAFPDYDCEIDHIAMTDSYIDSQIYPNKYTKVALTVSHVDQATDQPLFGVRNGGYSFIVWFHDTVKHGYYNTYPVIGSTTGAMDGNNTYPTIPLGTIVTMEYGASYGISLTPMGGEKVMTRTPDDAKFVQFASNNTSTQPLYIFALRNGAELDSNRRFFHGNFYGGQIYQGDELVRDYQPCMKDNVPFIWDFVSNTAVMSLRSQFTAFDSANLGYHREPAGAKTIGSQTETISLASRPIVSFENATANANGSVKIDWDLVSCGSSNAADILLAWGPAPETLTTTNVIATAQAVGNGSMFFKDFAPDRVYYMQLVAKAGDEYSSASVMKSITTASLSEESTDYFNRGISIDHENRTSGVVTSHTLTFDEGDIGTYALYRAYGRLSGGDRTNDWEYVEKVADVAAATTTMDVNVPAGWGTTVKYLRYFLILDAEANGFTPVKYISSINQNSSSPMYINTGVQLVYGETLLVEWAQADLTGLSTEDKGWGASGGKNSTYGITAGGRRKDNKIQPYFYSANRGFTPNLAVADFNTETIYLDRAIITNQTWIEMIDLSDGTVRTTEKVNTTSGSSYSSADLHLFKDSHTTSSYPGKKRIYGASLKNDLTGAMVFNLIPGTKNGAPGFFDLVSGNFLENAGSGNLVAGDEIQVASFTDAVYAENLSLPSVGSFAISGTEQGDTVVVSGAIGTPGGATASVQVEISRTGDFDDVVVWPAATGVTVGGEWTVTIHSADTTAPGYIVPGATAYARVRVISDDSGLFDVSDVLPFTPLAGSALSAPTATSVGRTVTVTAPVSILGANTTYIWTDWEQNAGSGSSQKATYVPGAANNPAVLVFTVADYDAATLTVHCSNDCATVSWDATKSLDITVVDNTTYTWIGGATGAWADGSSWQNDDPVLDYPNSANCTALFPAATTSTVTVASSIALDTLRFGNDAKVKVTGENTTRVTLTTIDLTAQNIDFTIENLNFREVFTALQPGFGSCLTVSGGQLNTRNGCSLQFWKRDNIITFEKGAYCWCSGNIDVSNTCKLIVDDSTLDVKNGGAGIFTGNTSGGTYNGGEIIIKGRNPQIRIGEYFRNASDRRDGQITFVIPEGGFAAAPILKVLDSNNNTALQPFWGDTGSHITIHDLTLSVDPASPGLASGKRFKTPLVDWSLNNKTTVNSAKIVFGNLAHSKFNELGYDDNETPRIIYLDHKAYGGTVLMVQ